jgi:hypothetical protein
MENALCQNFLQPSIRRISSIISILGPSGILVNCYVSYPIAAILINIASSYEKPSSSAPPFALPRLRDPIEGINLPPGSPLNGLPLGGCKPIFRCPEGNNSKLGGCTLKFNCK